MAEELQPAVENYDLIDKNRIAQSIYPDLRSALGLQEGQGLNQLELNRTELVKLPIAEVAFERGNEVNMITAPVARTKAYMDVVGLIMRKENKLAAYGDYFLGQIPDAEIYELENNRALVKQTNDLGVSIYWLLDRKSFQFKPYEHDALKNRFRNYNPFFNIETILIEDRSGQVTDLCRAVFGEKRPQMRLNPIGYTNNTDIATNVIDLFPLIKDKDRRYGYKKINFPRQIEVILHEFGHILFNSIMTADEKRKLKRALPALDGLTLSSTKQANGKQIIALREIIPNVLAMQIHMAFSENNFQITPDHTYAELLELYNTIISKEYDKSYQRVKAPIGFAVDKQPIQRLIQELEKLGTRIPNTVKGQEDILE